ncbi:MAG TPA: type II toxin-antitoxin system HicB family antitoxin [Bryobacteraceae bacterium]
MWRTVAAELRAAGNPGARAASSISTESWKTHLSMSFNRNQAINMERRFDVIIERDEEGFYVASVPQLPGCHTQARSLDEVTERIQEAIELCLEGGL